MLAIRAQEPDPTRVNLYDDACAQSLPIGSTGSRLLVALINALRRSGGKRGIAALHRRRGCCGGHRAVLSAPASTHQLISLRTFQLAATAQVDLLAVLVREPLIFDGQIKKKKLGNGVGGKKNISKLEW